MPRLRYLKDGTPVIRTGYQVSDNEARFGTWQVRHAGRQYLRSIGLSNEGSKISIRTFREMQERGMIWCQAPAKSRSQRRRGMKRSTYR